MVLQENLSKALQQIRTDKSWSIQRFADELYISKSNLQNLLSARGNPRLGTVEHIAERLQINPVDLLTNLVLNQAYFEMLVRFLEINEAREGLPAEHALQLLAALEPQAETEEREDPACLQEIT